MENKMIVQIWLFIALQVTTQAAFTCYGCSYSLSGDLSLHYECVTSPWNFTNAPGTMACEDTQFCITKTVYTLGYGKVWSASRSCGTPEMYACGVNCCQPSAYNVVCQNTCKGELCNNLDESTRLKQDQSGSKGPGDSAACLSRDLAVTSFLLILTAIWTYIM